MRDLGEYEEAKLGYLKILEIKKKVCGEDHADYASALEDFSRKMSYLGDKKGAK